MSSVNYNLRNRGVRLISADEAWVKGKNDKRVLNSKYSFVGKLSVTMPNFIVTASDKVKPSYKGDTSELNATAKKQIVSHFYNSDGTRNKKRVAYFGIKKVKEKKK